jgi:hypothetical protein
MEVTLDSLMEQLRATSTDVSNVTSQFLCLSDTQFLENRVYDDDDDDNDNEDDEEEKLMPSEEKEEEAKVRAVMWHCNISHQLISYRNTLALPLHQVVMKIEEKKVLEINSLYVCA